jgi:hypothetical protein
MLRKGLGFEWLQGTAEVLLLSTAPLAVHLGLSWSRLRMRSCNCAKQTDRREVCDEEASSYVMYGPAVSDKACHAAAPSRAAGLLSFAAAAALHS